MAVKNFLVNQKDNNYEELVRNMLKNLRILGISMSIKGNFPHNHLDCFSENLGDVSDEQGKKFCQVTKLTEEWY